MAPSLRELQIPANNNLVAEDANISPHLGQLSRLTHLNIYLTKFSSTRGVPSELGNLKKLVRLDVGDTEYTGPLTGDAFPSDMTRLSTLTQAIVFAYPHHELLARF